MSSVELKTFCTGSNYKAKYTKSAIVQKPKTPLSNSSTSSFATIFPNPTKANTSLKIVNPITDKALIIIYNLIGKEVIRQEAKDISIIKNEIELFTDKLNNGIYIVKVIHGDYQQSLKLEVQK